MKQPRNTRANREEFPTKLFAVVIAFLLMIIVLAVSVQSCSQQQSYNWNNLVQIEDRMVYQENGVTTSLTGIDVSSHQGNIDWNEVKNDGVDFAMIRCGSRGYTQGNLYEDDRFTENVQGAQNVGMPFGVYFFSQAITEEEAIQEAEYVLERIDDLGLRGPVAFDLEKMPEQNARANDLDPEQLDKIAKAFCKTIRAAGYQTLVYGNKYDLARYDMDALGEKIWYADYSASKPTTSAPLVMWQYTSSGKVNGISTNVDLNILLDTSLIHY